MALLDKKFQRDVCAHQHAPSRASSRPNTGNDIESVTYTDITLNCKTAAGVVVSVNHRAAEYILTIPPNTGATEALSVIPKPRIGDKAKVFIVDDTNPKAVGGYAEFFYTPTVSAAGAVSGTAGWKQVQLSTTNTAAS